MWPLTISSSLCMLWIFQTAEGISEYNILSMLHELTTKEKYILPQPKADEKGKNKPEVATLEEIIEEEDEEEGEKENSKEEDGNQGSVKTKDEDAGNSLFNFVEV